MAIFSIFGLVLKFLPYVVPLLRGLFGAINNLQTAEGKEGAAQIDLEKLQLFIEAETTRVITEVVNKNRSKLIAYVPNEEQAERDRRMDELIGELERAQKEYEDSLKPNPEQPRLEE